MSPKTICLCLAVCAAVIFGWKAATSHAYESAAYKVVESDQKFEIREYPELVLAATNMNIESGRENGSFMRLFRYISGANVNKQKVAMTTPVFTEIKLGEKQGQMAFVLPKDVAEQGAPKPKGDEVAIRKRPGGRYAVIRFSGRMNRESIQVAEASLREWIASKGLRGADLFESAGYDAPWKPARYRRNEVLIRLLPAEEKQSATAEAVEKTPKTITIAE